MKKVDLYQGDCYEILPQLINKEVKVDLILTDPPYLLDIGAPDKKATKFSQKIAPDKKATKFSQRINKRKTSLSFVADGFDHVKLWENLKKLQDIPNIIFFCSNKQVGMLQTFFLELGLDAEICVWHKTNAMPAGNMHLVNDIEFILVVRGKGATWNNDLPVKMKCRVFAEPIVATNQVNPRYHPCEKPIRILDNLIQLYSKENNTILDCFMGSGTTGISAVKNNRNFIGIECLEQYYNIAKQRINAVNNQTKLF